MSDSLCCFSVSENRITNIIRIFATSIAESAVNGAGFAREAGNP